MAGNKQRVWGKVDLGGLLSQFSRIGMFGPVRDADVSKVWPFLSQLLKYSLSVYQSLKLGVSSHTSP